MAVVVAQQRIAPRQHPARVHRTEANRRRLEAARLARQGAREQRVGARRAGIDRRPTPRQVAAASRTQPLRQQIEPVAAPRQGLARPGQAQGDPVQALRLPLQAAPGAPDERGAVRVEQLERRAGRRRHQLGRGGGCRRTQVGGEVGQGDVGLVADAAHHRHRRRAQRPHDALVVEGPEVLERAAAAADDEHVDLGAGRRGAIAAHSAAGASTPCTRLG
jgi:hypothetical protein